MTAIEFTSREIAALHLCLNMAGNAEEWGGAQDDDRYQRAILSAARKIDRAHDAALAVTTLTMPATLEIDVDFDTGTVIASRCWTPNVANGQLGTVASSTEDGDDVEGMVEREHDALAIAERVDWPAPSLHA